MFSAFPDGWPGAGLLLLRAAGAAVLMVQGVAYLGAKHELRFLILAVVCVLAAVGLLLLIGLLTRFVALVAALVGMASVFSLFPAFNVGPLGIPMTALLSAVIAVAVMCLGPGALSLDARLFGRREIIIPASSSKE